jgi:Fe-S-cluster-containing dehydrogenase component
MNAKVSRRAFFRIAGAVGASGLVSTPAQARAAVRLGRARPDTYAILIDTTRCLGCRSCEMACSEANHLPEPERLGEDSVFDRERSTAPDVYTVVNRYPAGNNGGAEAFRKKQCMHCVQPACASACLVRALEKTPEGPVVYHKDRCIGCRYCMVACPFNVPKFEYAKALPYIRKCTMCFSRLKQGKLPACAEACPGEAIQFGKRNELLEVAKTRIYQNPDDYVHHVYGEHEVGGTGVLYISNVPFEKLGLESGLGTTPYPHFTWPFLSAVPFVLTLWPPFLMGLYAFTRRREQAAEGEERKETSHES